MKKLIVLLLCIATVASASARKRSTTHGQARRGADVADVRVPLDTIVPASEAVAVTGYDKQRASRHETVFVTNNSDTPLAGLTVAIDYVSEEGSVMHRARRDLRVAVPPGETRKVDFPSWDRQNAFHYVGSRQPRATSTPYDVSIAVDRIFVPAGSTPTAEKLDTVPHVPAATTPWHKFISRVPDGWYGTEEAARIAEVVLSYQMDNGGWGKNVDYNRVEAADASLDRSAVGATIDNGATTTEMRFLAAVYARRPDARYRDAFLRGMQYIFDAQYDNGGWPQFFPPRPNVPYSRRITFNDNAMVNVLSLLAKVTKGDASLDALALPDDLRQKAREAFDRGIDCILRCQIRVDGCPTVWCAQHDETTFAPAAARAYELESYSGEESAAIAYLLMTEAEPTPEVEAAIDGAVRWFEDHAIRGKRFVRYRNEQGEKEAKLVDDPESTVWARFYDLETGEPFFCDRDGIKRASIDELGRERRGGYVWYTDAPRHVLDLKQTPNH